MTKYRFIVIGFLCGISHLYSQSVNNFSCATVSPSANQLGTSLNVSVLLDVSDRVTGQVSPGYSVIKHDVELARIFSESFICFESNKPMSLWQDDLKFIMNPLPSSFENVQKINAASLSFDRKRGVTKGGISLQSKNVLKELGAIPNAVSSEIENLENNISANSSFSGSDIYSFFAYDEVDNFIIPGKRNVLIIVTDGYIYHKDSKLKANNGVTYFTRRTFDALGLNLNNYENILGKQQNQLIPLNQKKLSKDIEVYVFGVDNGWRSKAIEYMWVQWLGNNVKSIEVYPIQNPAIQERQIMDIIYGR